MSSLGGRWLGRRWSIPHTVWNIAVLIAGISFVADAEEVAPPQLHEIDSRTRQRIEQTRAYLENAQWADAAELIRSLGRPSESKRNRLVVFPAFDNDTEFRYAVPLYQFVQDFVARLPEAYAPVRHELRRRGESLAKELFDQGRDNLNAAALRRIVASLLVTSSGDDALLRLGDLELQRGHYSMARGHWKRLKQELSGSSLAPFATCPDANVPPGDIHARLALASILEGRIVQAEVELAELVDRHPGARGVLGGVKVDLAQTLREMLETTKKSRTQHAAQRKASAIDPPFEPTWRIPLSPVSRSNGYPAEQRPLFRPDVIPVLMDKHLLYVDGSTLHVRELLTGLAPEWSEQGVIFHSNNVADPFENSPPFEIATSDSVILAVMPNATVVNRKQNRAVAVDIEAQGRMMMNSPLTIENEPSSTDYLQSIAGPILTHGNRQFVAMRDNGSVPETSVVCFNNHGRLWTTPICRSEAYRDTNRCHVTIAYAEGHVIVVTNGGVIASLNADTGDVRWMTVYPRSNTERKNLLARPWFRFRERSQPVVGPGMVIAAPADYAGILALRIYSGEIVWTTEHSPESCDIVEIVGVTDKHVIANGRRLWWFDAATGELSDLDGQDNPFPREMHSGLRSHGRASMTNGRIYWPARNDNLVDQVYVFESDSGRMSRQPIQLTAANVEAGNVIAASGMFLIAGDHEIAAYRLESAADSHNDIDTKVD